jgi:excisionase family DNA binding protein
MVRQHGPVAVDELRAERLNMAEIEVLTPEQVAELLQINRQTVMKRLRSGALKGFRLGKHWRIRATDLDAYIQTLVDAQQTCAEEAPDA